MLLSLVFAALITPAFALDVTGSPNYAMVRGVVTDGSRPLSNVVVKAYGDTDLRETRTDRNGQYYFMTLLPGTYTFHAVRYAANVSGPACIDDSMELAAGQLYEADLVVDRQCV